MRFRYKGSPFVLIATMPPVSLNSIPSVVKSEDVFETNKFPEESILAVSVLPLANLKYPSV